MLHRPFNIVSLKGGKPHNCGWCGYGCISQTKKSSTLTWLKEAESNGAKFIENCHVEKVLHSKGNAIGVIAAIKIPKIDGTTEHYSLRVKSSTVVVSCGITKIKNINNLLIKRIHTYPCLTFKIRFKK